MKILASRLLPVETTEGASNFCALSKLLCRAKWRIVIQANQNASAAATSLLPFLTNGVKITVIAAWRKEGIQWRRKKI